MLGRIVDEGFRAVESAASAVASPFGPTVIRLGVTGLARAGKTVFITSLVANLLDRQRMPGLSAAARGAIRAAWLQPQPDDTVPRFAYEEHLAALTGPAPRWPDSTRAVSQLRLSLKVQPQGLLGAVSGPQTVHLDIVDYPGEWLLDLALMDRGYRDWADMVLDTAEGRPEAAAYLALIRETDPARPYDEATAQRLARTYVAYLRAARDAGYADCTPGRFLMPGELDGSPALTFAPLPATPERMPRGALGREMERRYDAYKSGIVRPFFRDHFARIDRQVVLVDLLGAIHAGPRAMQDLGLAMDRILAAFRPGRSSWLAALLGARRVEKILFAATKADHVHHTQHGRMTAIMEALLRAARDRAAFAGAETRAMAIAALRATVEETRSHDGARYDMVRGTLLETGREAALYPGTLPDTPAELLDTARAGRESWLGADYEVMRFAPAAVRLKPGEGPPHIRLDQAAEFLIGDRV